VKTINLDIVDIILISIAILVLSTFTLNHNIEIRGLRADLNTADSTINQLEANIKVLKSNPYLHNPDTIVNYEYLYDILDTPEMDMSVVGGDSI
jgi:hypothetical protein